MLQRNIFKFKSRPIQLLSIATSSVSSRSSFLTARSFSSKQPEYLVSSNNFPDPSKIGIAFLSDETKQKIYLLHKENPLLWTPTEIAVKYHMSLERAQAVIILMRNREQLMEKENLIDIPSTWQQVYDAYLEQISKSKDNANIDKLAETFQLSSAEVNDIIEKLDTHNLRLNNVKNSEAKTKQILGEYEKESVGKDEDRLFPKHRSRPFTFYDDDLEAMEEAMKLRIQRETRALIYKQESRKSPLMDLLKMKFGDFEKGSVEDVLGVVPSTSPESEVKRPIVLNEDVGPPQPVPGAPLSRWKFAFKEVSYDKATRRRVTKENKMKSYGLLLREKGAMGTRKPLTVICTRDGRLREATALEESGRSWSHKPSGLDMEFIKMTEKYKAMVDPDQDEERVKALILAKREKYAQLKAAKKAAGGK